jgi:hypothetical protein
MFHKVAAAQQSGRNMRPSRPSASTFCCPAGCDCNGNGIIEDGQCVCAPGYTGATCLYRMVANTDYAGSSLANGTTYCPTPGCCAAKCDAYPGGACKLFVWNIAQQCFLKSSVPAPSSLANTFGGVPKPAPASCPGATARVVAWQRENARGSLSRFHSRAPTPASHAADMWERAPLQWAVCGMQAACQTQPPSIRHPHTFPAPRPAAPPPCKAGQYRPTPQQPCISEWLNDNATRKTAPAVAAIQMEYLPLQ